MKSLKLFIIFLCLVSLQKAYSNNINEPKLFVYYFHATSRCPIDLAIEKTAEETIKKYFQKELTNQIIIFKSIDYDDNYNREIVDKYKPFGASLMLIDANNTSRIKDFTDFAYKNVEEHPEKLIELLIVEIKLFIE